VTLLDHVNGYSTLATGGVKHDKTAILKIEDSGGKILEQYTPSNGTRVVDENYVSELDHIISTNDYRAPIFGTNNPLKFTDRPVAAKTGTTNEFKDGWTIGYTPSLTVGVWAGNNDNTPMRTGADGVNVAAPIWRSFMDQTLGNYQIEQFPKYNEPKTGKAIIDGNMDAITTTVKVCKIKKNEYCLANDNCPSDKVDKKDYNDIHTILYYVDRTDPLGDAPKHPESDPQYKNWEKGLQSWIGDNKDKNTTYASPPTKDCKSSDFPDNNSNNDNSNPPPADPVPPVTPPVDPIPPVTP